jgi:hypothetical protein
MYCEGDVWGGFKALFVTLIPFPVTYDFLLLVNDARETVLTRSGQLSRFVPERRTNNCAACERYQVQVAWCRVQRWDEKSSARGQINFEISRKLWVSVLSHFGWWNVLYSLRSVTRIRYPPNCSCNHYHKHTTDRLYWQHLLFNDAGNNWNHRTYGGRSRSVKPAWYRSKWPWLIWRKYWLKPRKTSVESVLHPKFEFANFPNTS